MRTVSMTVVDGIEFCGLAWYVEAFGEFDKQAFADWCGVPLHDFDEHLLRAVDDRVTEIQAGQFVRVDLDDEVA